MASAHLHETTEEIEEADRADLLYGFVLSSGYFTPPPPWQLWSFGNVRISSYKQFFYPGWGRENRYPSFFIPPWSSYPWNLAVCCVFSIYSL